LKPEQLVKKIAELIFEKKGTDVKLINLQPVTTVADYFIICSADSDTQVKAIADNIDKSLRDEGIKLWHKEGYSSLNWVLLDYVDVVVHVFKHESRLFYNLEKLWGDAPVSTLEDPKIKKPRKRTTKKAIASPGETVEK
jgi:ribosome-associated protein